MKYLLLCCILWNKLVQILGEDVCSFHNFTPRCKADQVLNITRASYGRMSVGTCVNQNDNIGCQMDVLRHFDKKCSGKTSCNISVPVAELSRQLDCLGELFAYLEIYYECVSVYIPPVEHCTSDHSIDVTSQCSSLASDVSLRTKCGLNNQTWLLQAQKGQKIELILTDFSWDVSPEQGQGMNQCPMVYGYLEDPHMGQGRGKRVPICGGITKERRIYTSYGHVLNMRFLAHELKRNSFLIEYKALGCPDFPKFAGTWQEREKDNLTVGCVSSGLRWHLQCQGTEWLGDVGNCTEDIHPDPEQRQESFWGISGNHAVVAFTIGCVTVLTCCVTVIAGYYCVKRYEIRNNQRESVVAPRMIYDDGTLASTHSSVFYRPGYSTCNTLNKHTVMLNCPTHGSHMAIYPPSVPERTTSLPRPSRKKSTSQTVLPQTHNNNNHKYINENTYFSNSMRVQNNPMFNVNPHAEAQYFVLENQRGSVTDDREQLYHSIHLRSTSSSISD